MNLRTFKQLIGFIIVGGIATLIDFIVLYALYEGFRINYLIATALAFIVSTIYNYWASMRFIFQSRFGPAQKQREFMIFLSLSIIGLILTQILMFVFVEWFLIEVLIAKLLVTGFVMIFNFVSRKLLLEDPQSRAND